MRRSLPISPVEKRELNNKPSFHGKRLNPTNKGPRGGNKLVGCLSNLFWLLKCIVFSTSVEIFRFPKINIEAFMKLSRLLLYIVGLAILMICSAPGWADKIPTKRPSSYGDQDSQVQLTAPSFSATQDGVSLTLNSVFCNSCSPGSPTNLEYFFDITLSAGANLASLTFGPGFDTSTPDAFSVVQFNPAADPGDACSDGTNYICHVPFTSSSLDFSSVESAVSCDLGTGVCTVTFTNFNFATLGGGPIVFAATTPFGLDTTTPFTPSVAINGGSTATVPEPSSLWFAGIGLLACLGLGWRQQSLRLTATN